MPTKYLSYTDRIGETAFAVVMVIIINGYVALSDLNTGFLYIVTVNIGACVSWGFIDGFIYAISSSIERNNLRKKLIFLKSVTREKEGETLLAAVKKSFDGTFVATFDEKGKDALANDIITHVKNAQLEDNEILTTEEKRGWLAILLIYVAVGFLLALPFLVLPEKILAWFVSNIVGTIWMFWFGLQLGKSVGRYRLILGLAMAGIGIAFLVLSYFLWAV
ncbi:MAG: hypothetical protein ACBZ72_05015 [Candidatus Bathyarchaeia archaeon]